MVVRLSQNATGLCQLSTDEVTSRQRARTTTVYCILDRFFFAEKSASTQAAVTSALSLSVLSALVAATASRRFLRAVNKHNCSVTIRTTRCDRRRTPLKHEDLAVSREHTERQGGCDSGLSRCVFSMKKKRPTIQ